MINDYLSNLFLEILTSCCAEIWFLFAQYWICGKRVTLMGHATALLQPFSRLNHTFVQNIPGVNKT